MIIILKFPRWNPILNFTFGESERELLDYNRLEKCFRIQMGRLWFDGSETLFCIGRNIKREIIIEHFYQSIWFPSNICFKHIKIGSVERWVLAWRRQKCWYVSKEICRPRESPSHFEPFRTLRKGLTVRLRISELDLCGRKWVSARAYRILVVVAFAVQRCNRCVASFDFESLKICCE